MKKLPVVLSVTAIVIAVLGITSYAAAHGVPHALFAHNADMVDGRHANQLIRLSAVHRTTDVDGWDGVTPITDSRAIKAPRKGFLLITYSVNYAQDLNETGTGRTELNVAPQLNGSLIGGLAWFSIDFSGACCQEDGLTIQRVVQVGKGTHTVSVVLAGASATNLVYVFERSLSVLYMPFNATGASPRVIAGAKVDAEAPRGQSQR